MTEEEKDKIYNQGYDDGYDDGKAARADNEYDQGYDDGYEAAKNCVSDDEGQTYSEAFSEGAEGLIDSLKFKLSYRLYDGKEFLNESQREFLFDLLEDCKYEIEGRL